MKGFKRWALAGALVGVGLLAAGCADSERSSMGEGRGSDVREGKVNDSQALSSFGQGSGSGQGVGGSGGADMSARADAGTQDAGTGGSGLGDTSAKADGGTHDAGTGGSGLESTGAPETSSTSEGGTGGSGSAAADGGTGRDAGTTGGK